MLAMLTLAFACILKFVTGNLLVTSSQADTAAETDSTLAANPPTSLATSGLTGQIGCA